MLVLNMVKLVMLLELKPTLMSLRLLSSISLSEILRGYVPRTFTTSLSDVHDDADSIEEVFVIMPVWANVPDDHLSWRG